jgi:hypothetical protein
MAMVMQARIRKLALAALITLFYGWRMLNTWEQTLLDVALVFWVISMVLIYLYDEEDD